MVECQNITDIVERLAPISMAATWDSVGLTIGSPGSEVSRVLVALDVTEDVLEEALAKQVDLIISHHPLFLQPLKDIRYDLPQGRLLRKIIASGLMLYTAHTNLDVARGGVNDLLAACLGIEQSKVLSIEGYEKLYKIVVFIPQGHEKLVRDAMTEAGAGWLGNYSHCTFQTAGAGTFLPRQGSKPFIGEIGDLEKVEESRLETIVPAACLQRVVDKMLEVHPYEEVAYDIYPLANKGQPYGLGRVGLLARPMTLQDFADKIKESLGVKEVRVVGEKDGLVQKIAVCGGSGGSLMEQAANAGAQVFVTGDVKYHQAQEAAAYDLRVVDAGHFATEYPVIPYLVTYLQHELDRRHAGVEVIIAQANADPVFII
ncbi:MAG: Nif3-like dinuclear metal center hexameric protein [Bacillota bacterium]